VFLGRPFGYAAAVGGLDGVRHLIRILSFELDRDMAMLGINRLSELGPGYLRRTGD